MNDMDFIQKVAIYRDYDAARQADLESFAQEYQRSQSLISELQADLKNEQRSRREYQQRAELAEGKIDRNQFALCLVDGDGYLFNRNCLSEATRGGGADAAHRLHTDINQYLKTTNAANPDDMQIMVIVFLHKSFIASTLLDAGIISSKNELDEFLWAFTSSHTLFQVIDCGPGKERVDAKLRYTYRFYAYNSQCAYIFLACCHDSGYKTELDKYRHNSVASPKTILVRHGNTAQAFYDLNLPFTWFSSTFDADPIRSSRKMEPSGVASLQHTRTTNAEPSPATTSTASTAKANAWSSVTGGTSNAPVRSKPPAPVADQIAQSTQSSKAAPSDGKGIPINRRGQRVDRPIRPPNAKEIKAFEDRITDAKLCNRHHLTKSGCYAYNCQYDHDPIDETLRQTLRYKARAIPCAEGSACRGEDCFYGHHCPWGNDRCSNLRCKFYENGLHDIDDLEIAKLVPPIG